jgi:hypothetical protein
VSDAVLRAEDDDAQNGPPDATDDDILEKSLDRIRAEFRIVGTLDAINRLDKNLCMTKLDSALESLSFKFFHQYLLNFLSPGLLLG